MSGGFTFVHAADLHLDSPFKGLEQEFLSGGAVPGALLSRLKESTFAAYENIIDLCVNRRADFLLLAGDVYDVADRSLRAQVRFRDGLARLAGAGIPAFVAHGNHDHCSGWRADLSFPDTVHVFSEKEVEARPVLKDGREIARVYGISYPFQAVGEDYSARFKREKGAPFSVALLHCNVGGMEGHENYAPCRLNDLLPKGFDYWALGHVHSRAVLHAGRPFVIYPGNPQGRHPRESGERGCFFVTVTESGDVFPEFVPTGVLLWDTVEISIEGISAEQELLDRLGAGLNSVARAGGPPVLARIILTGRGPLHRNLLRPAYADNLIQILRSDCEHESDFFVWPDTIQVLTGAEVDKGELAGTDTLLADFLKLSAEARRSDHLRRELRQVLSELVVHPRAGRYLDPPGDHELDRLISMAEDIAVDLFWDGDD